MNYSGPERRRSRDSCQEDIAQSLKNLEIELIQVSTKLADLHKNNNEQHMKMFDVISKHDGTIYGNGKEGLTTKISRLEPLLGKVGGLERSMLFYTGGLAVIIFILKFL